MTLTAAFHHHDLTFALQFVVVAGYSVPAQDASESQPASFRVARELCGFFGVESRQPMRGVVQAVIAWHGEIGVGTRRETNLRESPGPSTAAPGEQGRDGRALVQEDKAVCGRGGLGSEGMWRRRFAKELAMSRVEKSNCPWRN